MMLLEAQFLFALLMSQLISHAFDEGHMVTMGEVYRPPELAILYAEQGRGIPNSVHTKRLAVDLNLFDINGVYQRDSEAYRALGMYWEGLCAQCTWGGRFGDGNHFSIEWEGVK